MKYEEAIKELETIVSQIEKNELDIDQLTERLKEAQKLIKLCKDKLYKTDEEIKKILNSEFWIKPTANSQSSDSVAP